MEIREIDKNIGEPIKIQCVLDPATTHSITIIKRERGMVFYKSAYGIGKMHRTDFWQV